MPVVRSMVSELAFASIEKKFCALPYPNSTLIRFNSLKAFIAATNTYERHNIWWSQLLSSTMG